MEVQGRHYRTIWVKENDDKVIRIIDQRWLPHQFVIENLQTVSDVATAIKDMYVRGAGLIGATAGYGMYLATLEAPKDNKFNHYLEGFARSKKCGNVIEVYNRSLKRRRTYVSKMDERRKRRTEATAGLGYKTEKRFNSGAESRKHQKPGSLAIKTDSSN